jgi:hypothetical protein
MFQQKRRTDERAEHRARQTERMTAAPLLTDEFPHLRSLSMELGQYDGDGVTRMSQMKQSLNLSNASSILRIHCGNTDCVRGDFDLTQELSQAVASRRATVSGELQCQGWRNKAVIEKVRCGRVLRYKLFLGYA